MSQFDEALAAFAEYGTVAEVRHSLALVQGLPGAVLDELVYLESGVPGRVAWLAADKVYVTLLTNQLVRPGERVARAGRPVAMHVGSVQQGQVVNPLGEAVFAGMALSGQFEERPLDQPAPALEHRAQVKRPLPTGTTVVDLLVPLAAGQREAVFGDRKTGKTSFLLSVARAHAAAGGMVVYALIGRPSSDIKRVYDVLREDTANQNNIIIVASKADDAPSLVTLTPFSAMTVAEYWRDAGRDVLLILHDLSTHAKFHREVALVAGEFPGRESYPGDIFHEHARLLERAGSFTVPGHGDVAITCLPVVETIEEDLASYIVSNVISITDGHLMFDRTYYSQGQRPAVKPAASVTRVGIKAQTPLVKQFHRHLLAFLDTYEQAQRFGHFGDDLSPDLKKSLQTGKLLTELFTQSMYQAVPAEVELVLAAAIVEGWFNELPAGTVTAARDQLADHCARQTAGAAWLAELVALPSVETFVAQLQQSRDQLLSLCQATKTSVPA